MESYPIATAPSEALLYLCYMGVMHAILLGAGLVLATPLLFRPHRYLVFARGYIVFNLLLWLAGGMLNALWSCTIFGALYYSTDYVVDFSPFWPITRKVIDAAFGDKTGRIFHGLGLLHLQIVWFAFAFTGWAIAAFLYSRIRRIWNPQATMVRTAG